MISSDKGMRQGSITVFLTLSGLLILAMIGTCLETARLTVCANHGARTLRAGTDALLTEYSYPLYEHYGLFFLETAGTPYQTVIANYIGDTLSSANGGYTDFLSSELAAVDIKDKTYAGDDKAKALQDEIITYMKTGITTDILNKFLKKGKKISALSDETKELEDELEEEKKEAELDKYILSLMKYVDGISVSHGHILTYPHFAKMFSVKKKPSGNDFGITEAGVWEKIKNKINTAPAKWKSLKSTFISELNGALSATNAAIKEGKKLQKKYKNIKKQNPSHSSMVSKIVSALPSLNGNKYVLKQTKKIVTKPLDDTAISNLDALWKNYDTTSLSFDYTGINETGGAENPFDALKASKDSTLLSLVCEDTDKISKKSIDKARYYESYYKSTKSGKTKDYEDRVSDFTDSQKLHVSDAIESITSYGMDKFALDSYITKMFNSYTDTASDNSWKRALKYQWEYVIAGERSDKDNLEAVLLQILPIRIAGNITAFLSDNSKKSQAYATAAAVVGFTGLEPLIRLTQTLILITWIIVESLTDVAGILKGLDVPLIKKSSQILTSLTDLFNISGKAITTRAKRFGKKTDKTFGYREYIMFLSIVSSDESIRYRVMDLIDMDMQKNSHTGFRVGKCVFDITVCGEYRYKTAFFRLPTIRRMLGRDINFHTVTCKIRAGYL